MSVDYKWQSQGGILLDGSGDIAFTSDPMESYADVARSRVKAAVDGWKQYRIGAGLRQALGNANDYEEEVTLRRAVVNSLTFDFLPAGAFDVKTLALGETITVNVYLNGQLITSATVSKSSDAVQVNS